MLKRELYTSVLWSFNDWATTNLLTNKLKQFVSLCDGRMSLAVLAKRLMTEMSNFATPFTSE